MELFIAIESYLEPFGAIGAIWSNLKQFEVVLRNLERFEFGVFLSYFERVRDIWSHLMPFRAISSHFEPVGAS